MADSGSFLCWRDRRLAVVAGVSMSLALSLFYLAVAINLWTVSAYFVSAISRETATTCPPSGPCDALVAVDGTVNILAIGVAMEGFNILLACIALYGLGKGRRSLLLLWLLFLPIYIIYQLATVILMIINVQSLVSDNNSLPAVFKIYSLLASGASSLVVQMQQSPADAPSVLTSADINAIILPFVSVILFWFIQVIVNIVSESVAVKWYRSNSKRSPYYDARSPPSKADLVPSGAGYGRAPAPYVSAYGNPAMGYSNQAAMVYPTVANQLARPYLATYPAPIGRR